MGTRAVHGLQEEIFVGGRCERLLGGGSHRGSCVRWGLVGHFLLLKLREWGIESLIFTPAHDSALEQVSLAPGKLRWGPHALSRGLGAWCLKAALRPYLWVTLTACDVGSA